MNYLNAKYLKWFRTYYPQIWQHYTLTTQRNLNTSKYKKYSVFPLKQVNTHEEVPLYPCRKILTSEGKGRDTERTLHTGVLLSSLFTRLSSCLLCLHFAMVTNSSSNLPQEHLGLASSLDLHFRMKAPMLQRIYINTFVCFSVTSLSFVTETQEKT